MTIAILLVATGKYISFFRQLYDSFEKHLFPGHEKHYYVFTDNLKLVFPERVFTVFQEHESWPAPTLHRYSYFSRITESLSRYEHVFYSDVDMRAVETIKLPDDLKLLAVLHPGFYNTHNPRGTPETRPESRAYIAPEIDFNYVCGGFQGGSASYFIPAIENMASAIEDDSSKGIIPIFHDESMWNKFVLANKKNTTFLNPEYCFPESWGLHKNLQGLTPRLLALDKNHSQMRC